MTLDESYVQNVIGSLVPKACIEFSELITEWLDDLDKGEIRYLSLPPSRFASTACDYVNALIPKDEELSDSANVCEQTEYYPPYRDYSPDEIDNMNDDELINAINKDPNIILKIVNPSRAVLDCIFSMYQYFIPYVSFIDQEICDYYYDKGVIGRCLPMEYVTDRILEKEWLRSAFSTLPSELFTRQERLEILFCCDPYPDKGVSMFDSFIKAAMNDIDLLSRLMCIKVGLINHPDIEPNIYQNVALRVIEESCVTAKVADVLDRYRCTDYDELCYALIRKDPSVIHYIRDPSFNVAAQALSNMDKSYCGRVTIYHSSPGAYRTYPPEFHEAWPYCVIYEWFNEDNWIAFINKYPEGFLVCHSLTKRIIRTALTYDKNVYMNIMLEAC